MAKKTTKKSPRAVTEHEPEKFSPIDLFEACVSGKKESVTERKKMPQPVPVTMAPELELGFRSEEGEWSIQRLLETKEGDLYHMILAEIEFLDSDVDQQVSRIADRIARLVPEPHDFEFVKKRIVHFLKQTQIQAWFMKQLDRRVERETEYVGVDGSLHRMDRVIFDPECIVVIDFKIGEKKSVAYHNQLKNYKEILKGAYPGKRIRSFLAFVTAGEFEEVK